MQLALVIIFIGCMLLKVRVLLSIIEETMAESMWSQFYFGSYTTLVMLMGTIIAALFGFTTVVLQSVAASRAAPHLQMRGTRSTLHAPLLDVKHRYHYFISHVWSTGQDQARSIKELLKESLPGVRVFLDVDDLEDVSKLEEEVEASAIIIVFLSASYFASRNCMRELSHAVLKRKQVCLALLIWAMHAHDRPESTLLKESPCALISALLPQYVA